MACCRVRRWRAPTPEHGFSRKAVAAGKHEVQPKEDKGESNYKPCNVRKKAYKEIYPEIKGLNEFAHALAERSAAEPLPRSAQSEPTW